MDRFGTKKNRGSQPLFITMERRKLAVGRALRGFLGNIHQDAQESIVCQGKGFCGHLHSVYPSCARAFWRAN